MEKLTIVDIQTQEVTIDVYDIDEDENVDEEFIRNLGFNPDYCHWFFGTSFSIKYHSKTERHETT